MRSGKRETGKSKVKVRSGRGNQVSWGGGVRVRSGGGNR